MANTYTRLLYHVVFSTKYRAPVLQPAYRKELFRYFGGIAHAKGFILLEVNGVEDHVHLLVSIPAAMSVAKCVQLLKGNSSRWLHQVYGWDEFNCWQTGYGAFSIGSSQVDRTAAYIRNQEEHHRIQKFEDEYVGFLEANGIAYDPQYLFD